MTMPPPELFFDTMFAPQRTGALKAALDLELFTAIGDGASTVAAIADRCRASQRGMRILCDNLTMMGFWSRVVTEHKGMLEEAGFRDVAAHALPLLETIIVASV
jgi:hypothetical protein